jgi:glycerol-3-phosphate dehydrogenase (NAD(P)+)
MKITVLGAGGMATACAIVLAEHDKLDVSIWARNAEFARDMTATRQNQRLLPGVPIPDSIRITADIADASAGAQMLIAAIPTAFLRTALTAIAQRLPPGIPVISVIKGLENDTFARPTEIITSVLGPRPVAALGGPCHAEEAARRKPASVVIASEDDELAVTAQQLFATDRFRVYTNRDLLGVELAGALKNVVAIAAGICDGLGFGDNAKAALLTRGLAEMTRFGVTMGADRQTFFGLAGLGDLITTCFSRHSRNRGVGERLGRGESLSNILSGMTAVAEGVSTARSIHDLAEKQSIEMPITREVFAVLFEGKSPAAATESLMQRPPRGE